MKEHARALTRYAMAFVFLWFGINQLINPSDFMGYLPAPLLALPYAERLVLANGLVDLIGGLLLAIGWQLRIVATLMGLHLLSITLSLGYNDIAIRDFTLTLVTFAIALGGKDKWCKEFGR